MKRIKEDLAPSTEWLVDQLRMAGVEVPGAKDRDLSPAVVMEYGAEAANLIRGQKEKIARLEAEAAAILDECREEPQGIDNNFDGPLSAVRWLRFAYTDLRSAFGDSKEKIARLEAEAEEIVRLCSDANGGGSGLPVVAVRQVVRTLAIVLEQLEEAKQTPAKRRHLPDERASRTVKITVAGLDLYLTVGMYEDGTPGEVFVRAGGGWDPTVRALLDQWAIAVSVALQWGAEPSNLFGKFARQRFPPEGPASLDLGLASSPLDAIARWVLRTYYPENQG